MQEVWPAAVEKSVPVVFELLGSEPVPGFSLLP